MNKNLILAGALLALVTAPAFAETPKPAVSATTPGMEQSAKPEAKKVAKHHHGLTKAAKPAAAK